METAAKDPVRKGQQDAAAAGGAAREGDASKGGGEGASPTFNELFEDLKRQPSGGVQEEKVSPFGSADALFKECLDSIRRHRLQHDPDVDTRPSPTINKLTMEELDITRKIFQRVDPEREVAPRLEHQNHYIDPYWNPFHKNDDLKEQVAAEFNDYARMVGAAEARRQRIAIRRSLMRQYRMYDPYSAERNRGRPPVDPFPTPHKTDEQFWDPPPVMRRILRNHGRYLTWRDVDVLHHFVSENGFILPRRITHATRRQQRTIFGSIVQARQMAVLPYDWKPTPAEMMPVMDPLQYLADKLTERYMTLRDRRAQAILKVMVQKYPNLNYFKYLKYEAKRAAHDREETAQAQEEAQGDFSRVLSRYKRAHVMEANPYRPDTTKR